MKKKIIIPLLVIGMLAIITVTTVGMVYTFSPSQDSEIELVSLTTQAENDIVNVVLTCTGNESGNTHRFKNNYAYVYKIQLKNDSTDEVLYQEQYNWRHRNKIQNGKNFSYQFHIEGLEKGQMITLRIEYNEGKIFTYQFQVKS